MSSTHKRPAKRQAGRATPARSAGARAEAGAAPRPSLYDEVTDRIIAELEGGRVPWVQPWGRRGGATAALPRNAASKRPYSGINVLILWGAVIERAYPSQDWLTFQQAQQLGGMVRKGERGTQVVFADRFTPQDEKARASEQHCEPRTIPFLKRFTLFNVAQCEGLGGCDGDPAPLAEPAVVAVGEALIHASGVEYQIGGNRAFYAPILDFVQVPPPCAFFDRINYYRTALHELTHATGHATRLGRDLSHAFGSAGYAREELVAELGSAFLCASLGIVPTVRHCDYLACWLDLLKGDNRAIFRAASAARKAADWLLARLAEAPAEAAS
ncbi:ArdC family protein [Sphingomonas crusticola]|uniref:ArdC family protein n=1 Tax=Sphingomonas crusticola TaxID=1697973 RepID=UPI0013C35979|nr:zincin-like metallopeptidase domain-containing protein [Sphingomonas crusticola]